MMSTVRQVLLMVRNELNKWNCPSNPALPFLSRPLAEKVMTEPYAGAGSRAPSADGNDDDQTLLIANFPPHRVSRLPSLGVAHRE